MQAPTPSFIDTLQGQVPPVARWCLFGMGAAAGWHFAQVNGSPVPFSCIVAGAAGGFCLLLFLFAGLRLLKLAVVLLAFLVVVNYAVLIPFGYGDHMAAWLGDGQAVVRAINPAPLADRWAQGFQGTPQRRRMARR